jgi:hypothetical protein
MNIDNSGVGFEEIHITKRVDGKGFTLKARGLWNGEPCTIDVPFMQQPSLTIDRKQENISSHSYLFGNFNQIKYGATNLEFLAEIKPENEKYYTVTIDPDFHFAKQIKELENELDEIKRESEESIQAVVNKIEKLKSAR